ncbi:MAG: type 4a pilus biogenesis protein PilO [Candidatus Omnitrophota bacterium]
MFKIPDNRTIRVLITYLIFGLVLILLYFFAGLPISGYSKKLKMRLVSQTQTIEKYENLIRSHPDPKKEIEIIEMKIQELKDKAASQEQIPRIIQQLARKTNELNISTVSIKPREDIDYSDDKLIKGVNKVYIEIEILSPYDVVGDYLKALTELQIILTVEDISIEKKQGVFVGAGSSKDNELFVTLLLSAYMVLEI